MTKQQAARLAAIDRVLEAVRFRAAEANFEALPGDGNEITLDDELDLVSAAAFTLSNAWDVERLPLEAFMTARYKQG